jgi:hypothetical protein
MAVPSASCPSPLLTPRATCPGRRSVRGVLDRCNARRRRVGRRCNAPRPIVRARLRRRRTKILRHRGDRGPGRIGSATPGDRPSRRCGAARDDDVDSAAFVCPEHRTGRSIPPPTGRRRAVTRMQRGTGQT